MGLKNQQSFVNEHFVGRTERDLTAGLDNNEPFADADIVNHPQNNTTITELSSGTGNTFTLAKVIPKTNLYKGWNYMGYTLPYPYNVRIMMFSIFVPGALNIPELANHLLDYGGIQDEIIPYGVNLVNSLDTPPLYTSLNTQIDDTYITSSTLGGGSSPYLAFNGDSSTHGWVGTHSNELHHLDLDVGGYLYNNNNLISPLGPSNVKKITTASLSFFDLDHSHKQVQISGSIDGSTWISIAEEENVSNNPNRLFIFDNLSPFRYYRLSFKPDFYSNSNLGINEVEFSTNPTLANYLSSSYFPIYEKIVDKNIDEINEENLILIKDDGGSVYMPDFQFNGIGDFIPGKGYQVKLKNSFPQAQFFAVKANNFDINSESDYITIQNNNRVILDSGWSIIGYNRLLKQDVVDVLKNVSIEGFASEINHESTLIGSITIGITKTVTGVGTQFTQDFTNQDTIKYDLDGEKYSSLIAEIQSDTSLTLTNYPSHIGTTEYYYSYGYVYNTSILSKVGIIKDNNGAAYLPEWGFNGIGDFIPGQGYQIKLTEQINGFLFPSDIIEPNNSLIGNIETGVEDNSNIESQLLD